MMRSLWTAASGMTAQQQNVDTISHNLANVNTTGYKKERMEFQSLLYETMRRADMDAANQGAPVNLQVGHGVRPVATSRNFSPGNMQATGGDFDFYIDGDGFFVVRTAFEPEEKFAYTRDGSLKLSPTDEGLMLVTSTGNPIMTSDYDTIVFDEQDLTASDIQIDDNGEFYYVNEDSDIVELGIDMALVQFTNKQGLEAIGGNLYRETVASGNAMLEMDLPDGGERSQVIQRYLEMSNVQVAEEMVNLIVAQRAYELNSKAIQASDEMLQQANNLRR